MRKYEIVPHTADIALRIEADTPEEFFRAALQGMSSIIKKNFRPEGASSPLVEKVSVKSLDRSSLLVDFLNEVLALTNEVKGVFCNARFDSLTESSLEAEISGAGVDSFDEDIKAATYHGAVIRTNDEGNLEATVLFDI